MYLIPEVDKMSGLTALLTRLLGTIEESENEDLMIQRKIIVFCNQRTTVDEVAGILTALGFEVATLHGTMDAPKRKIALDMFLAEPRTILVATGGLAGRGLDLPDVSHVINYDLPMEAHEYVHRVGRTARAGAAGQAVSFVTQYSVASLLEIEKYTGKKLDKLAWGPNEYEAWQGRVSKARQVYSE